MLSEGALDYALPYGFHTAIFLVADYLLSLSKHERRKNGYICLTHYKLR
jgi:hypothetical protein